MAKNLNRLKSCAIVGATKTPQVTLYGSNTISVTYPKGLESIIVVSFSAANIRTFSFHEFLGNQIKILNQ